MEFRAISVLSKWSTIVLHTFAEEVYFKSEKLKDTLGKWILSLLWYVCVCVCVRDCSFLNTGTHIHTYILPHSIFKILLWGRLNLKYFWVHENAHFWGLSSFLLSFLETQFLLYPKLAFNSLYLAGWPQTAGSSASRMRGLQTYTTMPGSKFFNKKKIL